MRVFFVSTESRSGFGKVVTGRSLIGMTGNTMISMKMSATWDTEKSSSSTIQRICQIQLAQIILDRPIEPENTANSFHVAVRMRNNARRVLRSPEIVFIAPQPTFSDTAEPVTPLQTLQASGGGSVSAPTNTSGFLQPNAAGYGRCSGGHFLVDLTCTIQYLHVLKVDCNILQILLQRRKKYKNTTMNLGYKTLAYCNINLSQVLQRRIEHRFLDMYGDPKCMGPSIARIEIQYLSTVPTERDLLNGTAKAGVEDEEEEDIDFNLPTAMSDQDDYDPVDDSEDEQIGEEGERRNSRRKKISKSMSVGQIKQKFVSLLKRVFDPNEEIDACTSAHLWDEIGKMEAVSDVDEDSDLDGTESISLRSTPRPTIRPFFGHTGSSEETLSVDAGARILRRLQKEALIADRPSFSSGSGGAPGVLCEQTDPSVVSQTDHQQQQQERRRTPGVKFPARFGQIRRRGGSSLGKARVVSQQNNPLVHSRPLAPTRELTGDSAPPVYSNQPTDSETHKWSVVSNPITFGCVRANGGVMPESLESVHFLVSNLEPGGRAAALALSQAECPRLTCVSSFLEVKQTMGQLVLRTQMQSVGRNTKTTRVCVVGGDTLLNSVLRAYVEQVASRPEAVAAAFRFYLVPVSGLVATPSTNELTELALRSSPSLAVSRAADSNKSPVVVFGRDIDRSITSAPSKMLNANLVAQRLCCIDAKYSQLFCDLARGVALTCSRNYNVKAATFPSTTDVVVGVFDGQQRTTDVDGRDLAKDFRQLGNGGPSVMGEFINRVVAYLSVANNVLPLPIGECLVAGLASKALSRMGSSAGTTSNSPFLMLSSSPPDTSSSLSKTVNSQGTNTFEVEDSRQIFVPFLLGIGLGSEAILPSCLYSFSQGSFQANMSRLPVNFTPSDLDSESSLRPIFSAERTTYELQLEYWSAAPNSLTVSSSSPTGVVVGGGGSGPIGISGTAVSGGAESIPAATALSAGISSPSTRISVHPLTRPSTSKITCKGMLVALKSPLMPQQTALNGVPQKLPLTMATQLNIALLTREKKPKIMRIGKRTKEVLFKPEALEGVTRLMCTCKGTSQLSISSSEHGSAAASSRLGHSASAVESCVGACGFTAAPPAVLSVLRTESLATSVSAATAATSSSVRFSSRPALTVSDSHRSEDNTVASSTSSVPGQSQQAVADHSGIKLSIDGVDWPIANFFQVSPGWRTHVKIFPLVTLSPPDDWLSVSNFALPVTNVIFSAASSTAVGTGTPTPLSTSSFTGS